MMKKLPDAEFEVMQAVWRITPPVTTALLTQELSDKNSWKAQTLLTLLSRLVERGFLRTEKNSKERTYFPLINEKDYLRFETISFIEQYHNSSFSSLVSTLYNGKKLSDSDLDELSDLLQKRGE